MGGNLQYSMKPGYPVENDDDEYLSMLSPMLLATIQEAKDRISQIEYIFFSQLSSNFEAKSKSLQKIYLEAKREADDSWKEREKDMLLLIGRLQLEKQEVLEENRCLKLEKRKSFGEMDEKANSLVFKKVSEVRIDELEQEVRKKSKEVDEGTEMLQEKFFMILDKRNQLKECQKKTNGLLATVKNLEKEVEVLENELRAKTMTVAEKKELAEILLPHLSHNDQLWTEQEKEKEELVQKLECLKEDVSKLQKQLERKTEELEDGRGLQAHLLQLIDENKLEISKQKQLLKESENDRRLLLEKVNVFEGKINELKGNLSRSSNVPEGKDSFEQLLQQIVLNGSQLLAEKKKTMNKSQHASDNAKTEISEENMLLKLKLEEESGSITHQQIPTISPDFGSRNPDAAIAREIGEKKSQDAIADRLKDEAVKLIPKPSFRSSTSSYIAQKCPSTVKSVPVLHRKRSASRCADSSSSLHRQGPDSGDDDFDFFLKGVRKTLNMKHKEKS